MKTAGSRLPAWQRNSDATAYLFLAPWIVGFTLFSGLPILASFVLSLTHWDIIGSPIFIGLKNYVEMFSAGSSFSRILATTAEFTVLSVIVTMAWSLLMAVLLSKQRGKTAGFFQFFFFVPAVMPSVALAFVFQLIFNQDVGILNYVLGLFGVSAGPNWLMDRRLVVPSIIFVCLFTYSTGQMMLIFLAALKDVPKELYEACELDGGGALKKFRHVTISSISPIILFNLVIATINALNGSFSIIYPLTDGGPALASEVISLDIYHQGFKSFRMGYASAVSTVLFAIVAIVAWLQFRLSRKAVEYEN
jgi:multiple sugar transport system permease protein